MNKSLTVALLLVATSAHAARALECPQTLDVAGSVSVPAGWQAIAPRGKPALEGITVYDRHPKELASQVPTELPAENGFERMEWDVGPDSSRMWLECRYRGTQHTIAKALPSGYGKCVAYYKQEKHGLGPLMRFECK